MAVTDSKRTGLKARKLDEFNFDAEPGDCMRQGDRLNFACPGCGQWGGISAGTPKPAQGPSWQIVSGSLDDPTTLTLAPSINCVGCCGWHGFLRAGVFESC